MKYLRFLKPSSTTVLSLGAMLALVALTLVLPGCGGVDSGGTGQTVQTSSSGRISGFGSIIVNGIRYDDSAAVVVDDDGAVRTPADLRLGMVVEVLGERRGDSATGVAERIQFGNEIAGPVESVDAAAGTLVVLGQTVRVDADTLFDGYPAGLADVRAGHQLEVFAFQDAGTGIYTATRIERETAPLAQFKLRGRIAALAAPPARTFSIGNALIDYGSVTSLPTLANGLSVRVTLATTPVSGRWVASAVHSSQRNFPTRQQAEVEGFVSSYLGPASFLVAGIAVDASAPGLRVRRGNLSDLANGVRVEVEGEMHAGVLVARELDFKRGGQQEFELHGTVEAVDTGARTLSMRGVTVAWDDDTRFAAGTAAQLVVGAQIEAKGTPSGGVRILAESIRFER